MTYTVSTGTLNSSIPYYTVHHVVLCLNEYIKVTKVFYSVIGTSASFHHLNPIQKTKANTLNGGVKYRGCKNLRFLTNISEIAFHRLTDLYQ